MANRLSIPNDTFWQTLFYSDATDDDCEFIVISHFDKIIDDEDVTKGYVTKDEVLDILQIISPNVTELKITDNSFLVEIEVNNDNGHYQSFETRRIQVK